jgi:hypothetical protein
MPYQRDVTLAAQPSDKLFQLISLISLAGNDQTGNQPLLQQLMEGGNKPIETFLAR